MTGFPAAQRLFVGVGVGTYDHPDTFSPLGAAEEVAAVAQVLEGMGYGVQPHLNPDLNQAGALLDELATEALPAWSWFEAWSRASPAMSSSAGSASFLPL